MFKELDPDDARRAVEGIDDILTERSKALSERLGNLVCPKCNGTNFAFSYHFTPNDPLPVATATCQDCGRVIEVSVPASPDIEWTVVSG